MFSGLLNTAKSAVSSLVLKYVARASVAVPFLISIGFALAAGTVMLTDRYGQQNAYWIMAGGLALAGLLATLFVSVKEQEEIVADNAAASADTGNVATEAMAQAPLALIGGLLTLPGGATTTWGVARLLGKNYALVLLLVIIGALFWPKVPADAPATTETDGPLPDAFASSTVAAARSNTGAFLAKEALTIVLGLSLVSALVLKAISPDAKQAMFAAIGF